MSREKDDESADSSRMVPELPDLDDELRSLTESDRGDGINFSDLDEGDEG